MIPGFWFALLLTVLAGLSTSIGGAIGVLGRADSKRLLSLGLGFSAGVMVYVSLVEILPEGQENLVVDFGEQAGTWYSLLAFFGGIAVIAIIDRLVPAAINPHEPGSVQDQQRRQALMHTGVLTAIALAIHNFPEGFATFISGLQEPGVALAVAVAIAIHNIPEGLAVAVPVHQATGSRSRGFWAMFSGGYLTALLPLLYRHGAMTTLTAYPTSAPTALMMQVAQSTDERIQNGRGANPAYFFAVLLWQDYLHQLKKLQKKLPFNEAQQKAARTVIERQNRRTAIPRFADCWGQPFYLCWVCRKTLSAGRILSC